MHVNGLLFESDPVVSVDKCVSLGSSVSTKEQLYIALIEGRHRPHEGLTLF